jgi:hypothetical protein
MTSERLSYLACPCRPPSETRHPEVVRRVITQVNNRIVFIFSLVSVKASKFRTVAAVTDRCYIQTIPPAWFGLFAGAYYAPDRNFSMGYNPTSKMRGAGKNAVKVMRSSSRCEPAHFN